MCPLLTVIVHSTSKLVLSSVTAYSRLSLVRYNVANLLLTPVVYADGNVTSLCVPLGAAVEESLDRRPLGKLRAVHLYSEMIRLTLDPSVAVYPM